MKSSNFIYSLASSFILSLALLSSPTYAATCGLTADARSVEKRIESSKDVFVGRVLHINTTEKYAIFEVEMWLKKEGQDFLNQEPVLFKVEFPTTAYKCEEQYKEGERWFFAGTRFMDPSQKLKERELLTYPQLMFFLKTKRNF